MQPGVRCGRRSATRTRTLDGEIARMTALVLAIVLFVHPSPAPTAAAGEGVDPATIPVAAEDALNAGLRAAKAGDYKSAISQYDGAIQLAPDFADAYFARGVARDEIGDFRRARDDYDRVIALRPGKADAYYNRGVVLHELGDDHGALDDFNRALALAPENVNTMV